MTFCLTCCLHRYELICITSLVLMILVLGMQSVLEQEARIAGFKSEVSKSQELHLASLTRDTERLTSNLDKIRSEIR